MGWNFYHYRYCNGGKKPFPFYPSKFSAGASITQDQLIEEQTKANMYVSYIYGRDSGKNKLNEVA